MIRAFEDGAVILSHNNFDKLTTTNTGITVTGGWVTNGVSVATANVEHTNNTKSLFGNGNNLQIYHDGSNGFITNTGSGAGSLIVRATNFAVQSADGTDDFITTVQNAQVNLFYNGAKKFETTNTGVTVTGTITSNIAASGNNVIATLNNTDFTANNRSALKIRQQANAGGSFSAFLGATQSGNIFLSNDSITANHLVISNAGNIGIGTTSPAQRLDVAGNVVIPYANAYLMDTTGAGGSNFLKTINDFETVVGTNRGSAGFGVFGNSDIRLGFGNNYTAAQTKLTLKTTGVVPVSYTHLTLPTIYSV